MHGLPWRESASLILGCGAERLKILLLQRARGGSFSRSSVFPGGVLDPSDLSPQWIKVFDPASPAALRSVVLPEHAARPPILCTRPGELAREVALRITAIRETFEESGLLIAQPHSTVQNHIQEIAEWRNQVMENGSKFLVMCQKLHLYPDISALKLWSDWLTPIDLLGKRFDTVFFVAESNEESNVHVLQSEMQSSCWISPRNALLEMSTGKLRMAPPQIYEFSRLLRFGSAGELVKFADGRQQYGCIRLLPVHIRCSDGIVGVMQGDDAYPGNPDLVAKDPALAENCTMNELRQRAKNLHRIERDRSNAVTGFHLNFSLEPEHCDPLDAFTHHSALGDVEPAVVNRRINPTYA